MMMMTAKVNIKKVLIGLVAAAALIIGLISLLGGNKTEQTVTTMSDNDSRVQFLESQGWQVTTSPKEASQVKIPTEQTPVYSRYNVNVVVLVGNLNQHVGVGYHTFLSRHEILRCIVRVGAVPDGTLQNKDGVGA